MTDSKFSPDQFISGSTWMLAQEIESQLVASNVENERLRQAYDYILSSRNSVDKELHESYGEIQKLNTELSSLKQENERLKTEKAELISAIKEAEGIFPDVLPRKEKLLYLISQHDKQS